MSHLLIFSFISLSKEKYIGKKNVIDFTAYVFFPRIFMGKSLTFQSLIHFKFIFVCGLVSFFAPIRHLYFLKLVSTVENCLAEA